MAFITVLQLRNAVAQIPVAANALEIDVPDGTSLTVLQGRTRGGDTIFYHVRGYLALDTLTWTPLA